MLDDYLRSLSAKGIVHRYDALTEREREVFQLIAEGNSSKEIAELLSTASRPSRHTAITSCKSSTFTTRKALEPGANGAVLYAFWLSPVVKGADYTVSKILFEVFPDEAQEISRKFSGSYSGGQTLVNLQLLFNLAKTA